MLETGLWIVATPLGNVDDLSPRAREVLAHADVVLAEDTRRAGLLLSRLGLKREGGYVSFYEQNEEQRIPKVLETLEEGRSVALISDAGTPLLSDPGFRLVRACREKNFKVSPVPGPCAPVAALSACGLPPLPFTFLGFLPRKEGQMRSLLQAHGATGATLVFFERKSRLAATLETAADVLGKREFCVARELTKEFEEIVTGQLDALDDMDLEFRGEITVIVGPPEVGGRTSEADLDAILDDELEQGGKPKQVARRAAERANGWTSKEVYARLQQR